jgi:hypothetical protein
MKHRLKCWPEPFEALLCGEQRAQYRADDGRGFEVGDILVTLEWRPGRGVYTGRETLSQVTHIARGPVCGIPEGFVMMSVSDTVKLEE